MAYPYANETQNYDSREQSNLSTQSLNLTRVFGYMALAILLTALIAVGTGLLFRYGPLFVYDSEGYVTGIANETFLGGIIVGAVIAFIGITVCSILTGALAIFKSHKAKSRAVWVPFIIYAVCVGYLFGFLVLLLPWQVLAVSFGISSAVFGILALIGLISKGNLNPLLWISLGLMGSIMLISMMNLLLMWIVPGLVNGLFWIVSIGIVIVLMLTTIWDVWHIKKIASGFEMTSNMTAWCAFRLYVDFIAIFLRILYFVLIIYSKSKR